ncbi:Aldo/keto reductase [Cylindrobasidium torrendii FP15055 ss-10]|uniref:Aldo/keto reductase n=1 Tax=Cylindrobasidium torrendii FP15055 ss-10 TaxID=1314674 RepID=A0A0D7AV35_9AGAR|nr:Aldo/keto reductase [Cylindrobasidium torrendii FP15055 ss-10]
MHGIPERKLGGVTVPGIGFGAMGLSIAYGPVPDDSERLKVLDAAYAKGCTFWDTANIYGDSKDLLGKWFAFNPEKRKDIFLCTKFGFADPPRSDPDYIREQVNKSLERMGVDCVDLLYQHRVDVSTPIEKVIATMVELIEAGKVKHLGLSACSAATLRRAHAVHPIAALQVEYSPFCLDIERQPLLLLQTARELGVTIVAYSPLSRGFLTGTITSPDAFGENDARKYVPKYSRENFPKILELADRIREVASSHGATAGQASLAWILAQGEDFIVIPGTKKVKYVEENAAAKDVVLSAEEIAAIRKIAEETEVPGAGYMEKFAVLMYLDSPPL